jgi:Leucine-rich repeat (LRR) protein
MVGLVVVSALLEWTPAQEKAKPTKEESIAAIEKLGGKFDESWMVLDLAGSKVTDAGLAHLAGFAYEEGYAPLQSINLSNTEITDAGLKHLKRLTKLHNLNLDNTQITNAGVVRLKRLKRLTRLYLQGTRITSEQVGKLQKALPNCKIYHYHYRYRPAGEQ